MEKSEIVQETKRQYGFELEKEEMCPGQKKRNSRVRQRGARENASHVERAKEINQDRGKGKEGNKRE